MIYWLILSNLMIINWSQSIDLSDWPSTSSPELSDDLLSCRGAVDHCLIIEWARQKKKSRMIFDWARVSSISDDVSRTLQASGGPQNGK